ncbi:MAG: hypothetical protein IKU28_02970 [Erysipelotrichaceae bacterium]|nr:hypothetical protein [Erysipelotrichaceae bacterium]
MDVKSKMKEALEKKKAGQGKKTPRSFDKVIGKKKDNSECRRVNFNK